MRKVLNKRGFTLVEILVVVIILGLLVAIAIPAITRYIRLSEEKYYKSLEDELVLIGRDYYIKNKNELPRGQLNSNGNPLYINQVDINTLKEKGYVTNDIVDTKKQPCTGYIRVENKGKEEFDYIACIKCSDKYTSEKNNAYCTLNENFNDNNSRKTLLCNIDTGEYKNGEWSNKDITATITSSYESGETPSIGMYKNVNSNIIIKPKDNKGNVTIKESGNLKIYTYDRLGNRGECLLEGIKIDKQNPSVSFTSSNIIKDNDGVKVTATLKDNNGVVAYQVNQSSAYPTDGWTKINETKETTITTDYLTTSNSTTYYIWAKDVAGNVSNKKITVKINWGSWGTTSCSGLLCNYRKQYNVCTSFETTYTDWSYYTPNHCSGSFDVCQCTSGDCKFAVSYPSSDQVSCPNGYTRYTSKNCDSGKLYCGSDEWYEVADYTLNQAAARSLELRNQYKVGCVFYHCDGPYTMCRTRNKTGYICNSWTGFQENQSCDSSNSSLCQIKEEYQKGSYTYSLD